MAKKDKVKRVVENDEFVAMLQRMIRALEQRAVNDPAMLAQVIMIAQRLAEIPNVVISTSAARYAMNPYRAPSAGEIARLLGMAKQSVADRRKLGDRVLMERAMGEDTVPQRERLARTLAAKHAETELSAWLERRDTTV